MLYWRLSVRNGLECRPLFIPATPADYLSFILVASLRHLRYMTCKLWLKEEFHYHAARVKSAVKHGAFSHYVTTCYFRTVNQGKTSVNEDFSNLQENITFNLHDFRRPPRCKWDLRFEGGGGRILRGLVWYFLTDVSGQPIGPIFKGQAPRHLRMGPVGCAVPAKSVRNCHSTLCEISKVRKPQILIYASS
jgi:hypothetical protein